MAKPSPKFNVGDIVELKSGGPPMVVNSVEVYDRIYYSCTWFAGKKNDKARFAEETLNAAKAP